VITPATKHDLPDGRDFDAFTFLELDEEGRFRRRADVTDDRGSSVPIEEVPEYLQATIKLPPGVTDVFVWVHGWRNDFGSAVESAQRLFNGISQQVTFNAALYPALRPFVPGFVAVHWPSMSSPFLSGFTRIRDRAHEMTTNGCAEFVLASLLGYLQTDRESGTGGLIGDTLRSRYGYYVHCVGHSFGGRFLSQAIAAAVSPSGPTLKLLERADLGRRTLSFDVRKERFDFTVDTLLVFQMAAPADAFVGAFAPLLDSVPITGPICLTHSVYDRAVCFWHMQAEGIEALGCKGPNAPHDRIQSLDLKVASEVYGSGDLDKPLLSVDCSWAYTASSILSPTGAHSDFWYEESIHLLLSLVERARTR
jgi:hypothetical protein